MALPGIQWVDVPWLVNYRWRGRPSCGSAAGLRNCRPCVALLQTSRGVLLICDDLARLACKSARSPRQVCRYAALRRGLAVAWTTPRSPSSSSITAHAVTGIATTSESRYSCTAAAWTSIHAKPGRAIAIGSVLRGSPYSSAPPHEIQRVAPRCACCSAMCVARASSTHLTYQVPRSPSFAMTSLSRSAALRQFTSTARSVASGSPLRMPSMMVSCSEMESEIWSTSALM
jgi:hypothetical protein